MTVDADKPYRADLTDYTRTVLAGMRTLPPDKNLVTDAPDGPVVASLQVQLRLAQQIA